MFSIMRQIKDVKKLILQDYYNTFNCKMTPIEVENKFYELEIMKNAHLTYGELLYIVTSPFNELTLIVIKNIYEYVKLSRSALKVHKSSLRCPSRRVLVLNLPYNLDEDHLINKLKNIKNVRRINVFPDNKIEIIMDTVEDAMKLVLNNYVFKYEKRFLIFSFAPNLNCRMFMPKVERDLQGCFSTAISCYNDLNL